MRRTELTPSDVQLGGLHIVWGRGPHAFDEVAELVPGFLEASVDAARPSVLLLDQCAASQVTGEVRRRKLHGDAVGTHHSIADEHLAAFGDSQLLGEISVCGLCAERALAGGGIGEERATSLGAFLAAQPVPGQPLDGSSGADLHTSAGRAGNQAFAAQLLYGVLHGLTSDPVPLHQLGAGRQPITGFVFPGSDRAAEIGSDETPRSVPSHQEMLSRQPRRCRDTLHTKKLSRLAFLQEVE